MDLQVQQAPIHCKADHGPDKLHSMNYTPSIPAFHNALAALECPLTTSTLETTPSHGPTQDQPTGIPTAAESQAGHRSVTCQSTAYHAHHLHRTPSPQRPHATRRTTDASAIMRQHANTCKGNTMSGHDHASFHRVPLLGINITTTLSLPRQTHHTIQPATTSSTCS